MAGGSGVPQACGAGLRRGVVDGATAGRARSGALSGRWASGPVERGPGNGVEDLGQSGGAAAQDQLLPGTGDPAFDEKMAQVLCFYRAVALVRERGEDPDTPLVAYISYDEKPGIQAVGTTSPDRPPVPGEHATVGRDPEYVRHGTVTLMAGMDLLTGHVHRAVVARHRSREFVEFLRGLDKAYPKNMTLRLILDNHSVHLSRETRTWLASVPNRFEFVFTPKHASWLNLIETFFSKVARTALCGIRVVSTDELKERIERYIDGINTEPVVFKWTYGINDAIRV